MNRDTKAVPETTAEDEIAEKSNKRKHSDPAMQDSAYFKMMMLVQHLRPCFIEVLQTPDFRDCNASYEIRKKMKIFMDLYKQTQIEGNPMRNTEDNLDSQAIPAEKKPRKECSEAVSVPQSEHQQVEPTVLKKPPAEKSQLHSVENLKDIRPQGSYIRGGSVTSKNFMMFVNRKSPEYYGVTKESHRARGDGKLQKGFLQLETADSSQGKTTP